MLKLNKPMNIFNIFINSFKNYIKSNKIEALTILLITVTSTILKILCLKNIGALWQDELYSWYFAQKDSFLSCSFAALNEDIHMPLYFIILHYWIKFFGDKPDVMRFCSIFLTLPFVPLIFYFAKNLFNKTTAYFSVIFVTFNTFCIYYSTETRFYSLVLVLSLILAFSFCKMLLNFDKKSTLAFIISASALFYTFSITPLLLLSYFVVGIISAKNKNLIKFLISNLTILLLTSPLVCFTFLNISKMHSTLTYYPLDNFPFNVCVIYDILENFFANHNAQIVARDFIIYRDMFDNLDSFSYISFVIIPVFIALWALIRAIFSKNKNFYLFSTPSIIFLIVLYFLSKNAQMVLQTRYLTIIFPVVAVSFCFGLTSFKNKITSFVLFCLMIYLNITGLFFQEKTIFNMNTPELQSLSWAFHQEMRIKNDDLLLIPMGGEKLLYYIKSGKFIPFKIDEAVVLKDKKSLKFYFGDDSEKLNRDNIRKYLEYDSVNDIVQKSYENNLKSQYLDKMKPQERLFYFVFYSALVKSPEEKNLKNYYKNLNLVELIISKGLRDTYLILNKNLKLEKTYISPEGYSIYMFVKK